MLENEDVPQICGSQNSLVPMEIYPALSPFGCSTQVIIRNWALPVPKSKLGSYGNVKWLANRLSLAANFNVIPRWLRSRLIIGSFHVQSTFYSVITVNYGFNQGDSHYLVYMVCRFNPLT